MTRIQFDSRRSVEEWVGATPDSEPPPHVKLRVFERCRGFCHIARRKIRAGEPWDTDHVIPLRDWTGEGHGNRESNLAPALRDKHREKTAEENRERGRINRKKAKHLGLSKPRSRLSHPTLKRRFDGTVVRREEA